ncbi:hypothetical protein GCM10020221_01650 [Streptomyces thioluteus]|uniref:Uncharacterized protein n=1 Tax=Streptomyces thioluteus TaxID=66431 RepID=A0ABN3WAK0_STRTU
MLGARLSFRNADPEAEGGGGAIAVLWLPESSPTSTGTFPIIRVPD